MRTINLIFILFFYASFLSFADELAVTKIDPQKNVIHYQIKRLFIHFNKKVVALGEFDKDYSKYISVSSGQKFQTRFISPNILRCTFSEKLPFGDVKITVKKGFTGTNKDILKKDYVRDIKFKQRDTKSKKKISLLNQKRRSQNETRFRIREIGCSGGIYRVTKWNKADNINLPEQTNIECFAEDEVVIFFSEQIKERENVDKFVKLDSDYHKKVNDELINAERNLSFDNLLKFTLPMEEKEILLELTDEIKGIGRFNNSQHQEYVEPQVFIGGKKLAIKVMPKRPQFSYPIADGIIEKNGPWKIYFESVNVSSIKAKVKIVNNAEDLDSIHMVKSRPELIYPLKSTRNVPERFYFDLLDQFQLDKSSAYFLRLNFTDTGFSDDLQKSYILFNKNNN